MATFRGDFFKRRGPMFHSLPEKLAWRWRSTVPLKLIRDRVAKGYPRFEVKWATRAVYRNGMHQRLTEQNWARCMAFIEARAPKLFKIRGF